MFQHSNFAYGLPSTPANDRSEKVMRDRVHHCALLDWLISDIAILKEIDDTLQ